MLKTVSDAVLGFVEHRFGKMDMHEVGTALLYTVYTNMKNTYGSKKSKDMINAAVKRWYEMDEVHASFPFLCKSNKEIN